LSRVDLELIQTGNSVNRSSKLCLSQGA